MRLRGLVLALVWVGMIGLIGNVKGGEGDGAKAEGKKPLRVFFIGHSLYRYGPCNIPEAVKFLSEAAGVERPVEVTTFIKGGAKHQDYLNSPEVMKRLKDETWDVVCIAGNLNDMTNPDKVTLEFAKKLDAEVKSKNARLLEYVAWPWMKFTGEGVLEKRIKAQDAFNQALIQLGKETNATLMPCGPGLVNVIKKDATFLEKFKYGEVHVSPTGYYFTACVIFASIYNKSPEGLPSVFKEYNIDKDTAKLLQVTAWETVQEWQKLQAAK